MLEQNVIDAYRKERARWPYIGAKTALLIARHTVKDPKHEWKYDAKGYLAIATATFVEDGFDVTVAIGYEDQRSREYSETSKNTGIRNPGFNWDGDPWYNKHERYIELESGTVWELAEAFNGRYYGSSKGVAFEQARESLEEQAHEIMADDYTEYTLHVTASVNGTKLGFAAIGGIAVNEGYWGHAFEKELEDVLADCALVEEAIDEAKEALAEAIEKERSKLARMEALTV